MFFLDEPSEWCPNWRHPRARSRSKVYTWTLVEPSLAHVHTDNPIAHNYPWIYPEPEDLVYGRPHVYWKNRLAWFGQIIFWHHRDSWGRAVVRGPTLLSWVREPDYPNGPINPSLLCEPQRFPGNTLTNYVPNTRHPTAFDGLKGAFLRRHDPRLWNQVKLGSNEPRNAARERALFENEQDLYVTVRAEDFCESRIIDFHRDGYGADLQAQFICFDVVENPLRCEARNVRLLGIQEPINKDVKHNNDVLSRLYVVFPRLQRPNEFVPRCPKKDEHWYLEYMKKNYQNDE